MRLCRYERGVRAAPVYKAMRRAARLLLDICGGDAGPIIDVSNSNVAWRCSTLRRVGRIA